MPLTIVILHPSFQTMSGYLYDYGCCVMTHYSAAFAGSAQVFPVANEQKRASQNSSWMTSGIR
jgi:hypothetical protein